MSYPSRLAAFLVLLFGIATSPEPIRARQTAPASPPSSVADLLTRYEQGESTAALGRFTSDAVQALVRDLRRDGEAWTRAGGASNAPRRRVAVAAFALELIDLHSQVIAGATLELLDWSCGLMRDGPATPAERAYFRASLVMLQALSARWGIVRVGDAVAAPQLFSTHLLRAERRFPRDPEFVLMRAIAADVQTTWPGSRDDRSLDRLQGMSQAQFEVYRLASGDPVTEAEAQLRWGVLFVRVGRTKQALEHFDKAGTPLEPALRYWLHLFKGRAYEEADRPAEAIASYRLALQDVPNAQSAVMALAALLVQDHHPDEAAALVAASLAVRPAPLDPWIYYQYPHFRLWPGVMTELRRMVRP